MEFISIIKYLLDNYDITISDWYDRLYLIQCKKCKINELCENCNCYDSISEAENLSELYKYNKPTECKKYNLSKLIPMYKNYIDLNKLNFELCETILRGILKSK
jgi:hypothetical protein